jgi:glycosyltransferase involved in cell wall biosynthesis
MRLLMISWEYPPYVVGGMGRHVAELVPALSGKDVNGGPLLIDVLTTNFGETNSVEKLDERTTIHRVQTLPLDPLDPYNSVVEGNRSLIDYAHSLVKEHDYDLIHIHDWLVGEAGVTLKHEWRTPLLVTIHATERGRHQGHLPTGYSHLMDRMEWRICFESWNVIVCSDYMAAEVNGYFGTPMGKIMVIPNGVNPVKQYGPDVRQAIRREYAPNGERLLFFVGRIVYEKGVQVLLKAMPQILAQYPDIRLLVAGKNSRELAPQAQELGISDQVDFLGFISDERRDQIYQSVDAAIFPSLYEPFGIVALEAMATGCNVIASDVGGLSDVVRHEITGLTVYPNDPDSIAWAVDRLFSAPFEAERRRQRALYEAQTRYNWKTIASQTIELYERVVEERQRTEW